MNEGFQRLVLLLLAIILIASLKSHGTFENKAPVAFLRYTAAAAVVRVKGDRVDEGIYKFSDGASLATVINVTGVNPFMQGADSYFYNQIIVSGDIVSIDQKNGECAEITLKRMKAKEMILLGIPLDPNQMSSDDWQNVPGIAPRLASNIMKERQTNGAFMGVSDLIRVPGIGTGKIDSIMKYF